MNNTSNYALYVTEMSKLIGGLVARQIPFIVNYRFNGLQVVVLKENMCPCDIEEDKIRFDGICNDASYGFNEGLIEIMGDIVNSDDKNEVEGYLTATEILSRIDKQY